MKYIKQVNRDEGSRKFLYSPGWIADYLKCNFEGRPNDEQKKDMVEEHLKTVKSGDYSIRNVKNASFLKKSKIFFEHNLFSISGIRKMKQFWNENVTISLPLFSEKSTISI